MVTLSVDSADTSAVHVPSVLLARRWFDRRGDVLRWGRARQWGLCAFGLQERASQGSGRVAHCSALVLASNAYRHLAGLLGGARLSTCAAAMATAADGIRTRV